MKKLVAILIIVALAFTLGICRSSFASTNEPLKNIGKGLDDMFYGDVEVPDNMNETGTKGTPAYPECTDKTKDGVGRGIAKVVGGLWRIATFWYPEEGS